MSVQVGQKTFNFALKANIADAPKVEAAIQTHAAWMREHHSYDNSKIQLLHFYVAKSNEYNNPVDPSQGTTGNVLYSINEVYAYPEGIQQHMGKAKEWDYFPSFLGVLQQFGQVLVVGGDVIETL
ncbi:MAG: hypothetical protein EP343_34620 [Deltaproteobacteria bacterium]|nr:MAG: hypothetical protein EP343_34620 [Deltaproteobacteria bacterium]